MGDGSAIQWTEATWNPVTGCSKVSPGCAHCYAESLTRRFAKTWGVPDLPWTPANAAANVITHPERLTQPLRWKRPRMIFVNSMSDLFHEEVPDEFIAQVFAVMALAPRHTFQVLTKRPERMRDLLKGWRFCRLTIKAIFDVGRAYNIPNVFIVADELSERSFSEVLSNVWLGVSIENRRYAARADVLRETSAAVRFISAEPLLGPLIARFDEDGVLGEYVWPDGSVHEGGNNPSLDLTGIDWLIVGGESGPGHRPMQAQWVRDLREGCLARQDRREFCTDSGCDYDETQWPNDPSAELICPRCCGELEAIREDGPAFFFKQWGGTTPKAGGRELDGRTWDEMPAVVR